MVLVAIDDLLFSSKIRAVAKQIGVEVVFVRTPEEILDVVRRTPPALAVFDLHSAKSDPFRTIAALKNTPAGPRVRTVAFFAHVQTELADAARAAGADEVMPRSAFAAKLHEILSTAHHGGHGGHGDLHHGGHGGHGEGV